MPAKETTINKVLDVVVKLTKRFDKMDKRFDIMDERFDKVDERFDKMERRFDRFEVELFKRGQEIGEIKVNVADINAKIDHIYGVLDSHMKRIEEILQENSARDRQQERLEKWIFQLADASGVKLNYD